MGEAGESTWTTGFSGPNFFVQALPLSRNEELFSMSWGQFSAWKLNVVEVSWGWNEMTCESLAQNRCSREVDSFKTVLYFLKLKYIVSSKGNSKQFLQKQLN